MFFRYYESKENNEGLRKMATFAEVRAAARNETFQNLDFDSPRQAEARKILEDAGVPIRDGQMITSHPQGGQWSRADAEVHLAYQKALESPGFTKLPESVQNYIQTAVNYGKESLYPPGSTAAGNMETAKRQQALAGISDGLKQNMGTNIPPKTQALLEGIDRLGKETGGNETRVLGFLSDEAQAALKEASPAQREHILAALDGIKEQYPGLDVDTIKAKFQTVQFDPEVLDSRARIAAADNMIPAYPNATDLREDVMTEVRLANMRADSGLAEKIEGVFNEVFPDPDKPVTVADMRRLQAGLSEMAAADGEYAQTVMERVDQRMAGTYHARITDALREAAAQGNQAASTTLEAMPDKPPGTLGGVMDTLGNLNAAADRAGNGSVWRQTLGKITHGLGRLGGAAGAATIAAVAVSGAAHAATTAALGGGNLDEIGEAALNGGVEAIAENSLAPHTAQAIMNGESEDEIADAARMDALSQGYGFAGTFLATAAAAGALLLTGGTAAPFMAGAFVLSAGAAGGYAGLVVGENLAAGSAPQGGSGSHWPGACHGVDVVDPADLEMAMGAAGIDWRQDSPAASDPSADSAPLGIDPDVMAYLDKTSGTTRSLASDTGAGMSGQQACVGEAAPLCQTFASVAGLPDQTLGTPAPAPVPEGAAPDPDAVAVVEENNGGGQVGLTR